MEKIVKYSSLIGAFLIFNGVLKLIIYFSFFHIDIIDYLQFSEIITSFLDDINLIILFILFFLIVHYGVAHRISSSLKHEDSSSYSLIGYSKLILNKICPGKKIWIFIGVNFILMIIFYMALFFFNHVLWLYFIALYEIQFFLIFCVFTFPSQLDNPKLDNFLGGVFFSVFIALITVHISFVDYRKALNPKYQYTLFLENDTIITNSNLLFVGKTDNYTFLYDKKNNNSTVLFHDKLIKIENSPLVTK